jgi:hypothetical protein
MPAFTFVALTLFIFLAIVGGIIGIILEGRRIPPGSGTHNPATHDTVFPIVGWGSLFVLYFALEFVGTERLTIQFKTQLGTLALLPLFYATFATAWLIWRSGRRIVARIRGREPVTWHAVPLLRALRFPILLGATLISAALEYWSARFSLGFFLLAGLAVIFALIRKQAAETMNDSLSPRA